MLETRSRGLMARMLVEPRRLHPRRFVACDCLNGRDNCDVKFRQRAGMVALRRYERIAAGAVQLRRRHHEALDFGVCQVREFLAPGHGFSPMG
jgi:hypothetical protein